MLDADEQDIVNYLKSWPRQFVSGREIGRRASGKMRYREDPYWASQPLGRLVEKRIIEMDPGGHYRLIPEEKKQSIRKWVSPQIKKILEQSGKDFDGIVEIDEGEESP